MEGKLRHIAILMAVLSALSCEKQGYDGGNGSMVPVQLAVRICPWDDGRATKGNPSIITEINENFRGIDDITLLAFDTKTTIVGTDRSIFHPYFLPGISDSYSSAAYNGVSYFPGLVSNNNAHLYGPTEINLPNGTASLLAYGTTPVVSAGTEVRTLHLNGALTATGFGPMGELRTASEVSFSPVPIYGEGIPTEGQSMAVILNAIAEAASYTTVCYYQVRSGEWRSKTVSIPWNESIGDSRLKEYFQWFTNNGRLTTGSGVCTEFMLTHLYRNLSGFTSYETSPYEVVTSNEFYEARKTAGGEKLYYSDLYNGVKDLLLERFQDLLGEGLIQIEDQTVSFSDPDLSDYPQSYGLPDGAAVISWTGTRFEPVSETLDGVAPLSSYCYPPRLWYFANSTLSTSPSDKTDVFISDNESWQTDILSTFRGGKTVHGETKSVAIDDPLQYSCALLEASVRATTSHLDDADGSTSTYVTLTDDCFPVTGVIIGSQRSLNFDFTPQEDAEDYFLYDDCIDGVFLTDTDASHAQVFHTLVSQTPDGTPVYFCLELRNDSGSSFTGADGIVLPGAKFYLLGNIELPSDHSYVRVFEQDYCTRINCIVSSLTEARTAVPDLEHPRLSMGLQVDVNWIQSTPSYYILY